jgi:hypothetical protein
MQRLYKFIFLLFLALLAISFAYAFLLNWVQFKVMLSGFPGPVKPGMPGGVSITKLALPQALIYSLTALLIIVLLLRKAMGHQHKFTVKDIIETAGWFVFITTLIAGVMAVNYTGINGFGRYVAQMSKAFIFPFAQWALYVPVWVLLYFILSARIK